MKDIVHIHKHNLHNIYMKNMNPLVRMVVGSHKLSHNNKLQAWLVDRFTKEYIAKAMPEVRYAFRFKSFIEPQQDPASIADSQYNPEQ